MTNSTRHRNDNQGKTNTGIYVIMRIIFGAIGTFVLLSCAVLIIGEWPHNIGGNLFPASIGVILLVASLRKNFSIPTVRRSNNRNLPPGIFPD